MLLISVHMRGLKTSVWMMDGWMDGRTDGWMDAHG